MNIIKTLLLALLATILFYVYLEVERTNNSVMITKSSMPKNEHVIYRDGKRITVSKEEYDKLFEIPNFSFSKLKTSSTNKVDSDSKLQQLEEKSEIRRLKLTGTIQDGMSYKIKVYYTSDSTGYICGRTAFSFGIFERESGFYRTHATKVRSYTPIIKDGHHDIDIPLDEFRPFIGCSYHLNFIMIEITNNNLQNYNLHYGGYFQLFFPQGESSKHTTTGSPYNHHVGHTINMECTAKDFNDTISYFPPNCHLKSTINSFFTAQELQDSNYTVNITNTTQNEYELKRFFRNEIYSHSVQFIKRVSTLPKLYKRDLSYFLQKIEKLKEEEQRVDNYLQEMRKGLIKLIQNEKEQLFSGHIGFLERKLKTVEQSIESNQKIKKIQKELIYDTADKSKLDRLNRKITLDKLFLNNEFYKYQMLHFVEISQKDPNLIYYKRHKLRVAHAKINTALSYHFLKCRKSNTMFCKKLEAITTTKKEKDKKELIKSINSMEALLFLEYGGNLYYMIQQIDK